MPVPPRLDVLTWTAMVYDAQGAPPVPPTLIGGFVSASIWRRAFFPVLGPRVPGGLRYEASKA